MRNTHARQHYTVKKMRTKLSADSTKTSYELLVTLRNHTYKREQMSYVTHTTTCFDPQGKPPGTECSTTYIQQKSEAHEQSNKVSTCCKDVALVCMESNASLLHQLRCC
jgi:hypothetical protein